MSPLLLLLSVLLSQSCAQACTCNGVTLPNRQGKIQGECRTEYRGRPFCYVSSYSACPDRKRSKADPSQSWSYAACSSSASCPQAEPSSGSPCSPVGLKCDYYEECCCGDCGPALVAECAPFGWALLNTDRCLGGCDQGSSCRPGYQIFPGDTHCCDSTLKPARCCHQPGETSGPGIFCT